MTDPTYDPRIPITELERLFTNLDRQQQAHGQILERIQSRLTDLERGPQASTQRLDRLESRINDHAPRINSLDARVVRHGKRLDDLEAAAESEGDEPTNYEGYSDDALLDAFAGQYEDNLERVDPDLVREAVKRKNAR